MRKPPKPPKLSDLEVFINQIRELRDQVVKDKANPLAKRLVLTSIDGAASTLSSDILIAHYNEIIADYEANNKQNSNHPDFFGALPPGRGLYYKRAATARSEFNSPLRSYAALRAVSGAYKSFMLGKSKLYNNFKRVMKKRRGGDKTYSLAWQTNVYPFVPSAALMIKIDHNKAIAKEFSKMITFLMKGLENTPNAISAFQFMYGVTPQEAIENINIWYFPILAKLKLEPATFAEKAINSAIQRHLDEAALQNFLADRHPAYFNHVATFTEDLLGSRVTRIHMYTENVEYDLFSVIQNGILKNNYDPNSYPQLDRTLINVQGTMIEKCKLDIFWQVINAIALMHADGYAHKDIKLENIMLRYDPNSKRMLVKIIDFGYAKRLDEQEIISSGTPMYMPPEHFYSLANQLQNAGKNVGEIVAILTEYYNNNDQPLGLETVLTDFRAQQAGAAKLDIPPDKLHTAGNYTGQQDIWSLGVLMRDIVSELGINVTAPPIPFTEYFLEPDSNSRLTIGATVEKVRDQLQTIPAMADVLNATQPVTINSATTNISNTPEEIEFLKAIAEFKYTLNDLNLMTMSLSIIYRHFHHMYIEAKAKSHQDFMFFISPIIEDINKIVTSTVDPQQKLQALQQLQQNFKLNLPNYTGYKIDTQTMIEFTQQDLARAITQNLIESAILGLMTNYGKSLSTDQRAKVDEGHTKLLDKCQQGLDAIRTERIKPFHSTYGN